MESHFRLNPLVDGNAENLARRCRTEVRDVEVAIRAECHTGRNGEPGGYIFDIAGVSKAYIIRRRRCGHPPSMKRGSR